MHARNLFALGVVAACVLTLSWTPASAGKGRTVRYWLSAGVGYSSVGWLAGTAGGSLQVDHFLLSARLTGSASELVCGEEYEDYGLMAGHGWRVERVHMSVAGRLAVVSGREFKGPCSLLGRSGEWVHRGPTLGFSP